MDKTVGVVSLGCAKNLVDTERMLGILTRAGYSVTNDPAKAQVLIVNTCGFIEPAKQESIDTLLELAAYKKGGRCETLVATGCLSQRYREELAEAMPEIDILLGVREYETLPALLAARGKGVLDEAAEEEKERERGAAGFGGAAVSIEAAAKENAHGAVATGITIPTGATTKEKVYSAAVPAGVAASLAAAPSSVFALAEAATEAKIRGAAVPAEAGAAVPAEAIEKRNIRSTTVHAEAAADSSASPAVRNTVSPGAAEHARRSVAPRVLATPAHRAFLRIADGCDNRCAYCAIPLIRGGLVSEPMEKLVAEAESLADGGVTELTLIAQDTSCYGVDLYGKPKLPELLDRLCKIAALRWIRVLYTYPDTVTPALLDTLCGSEKLVRYLDMPLQHISDALLLRMNRRGSKKHIQGILEHIRTHAPDFVLRTTMMVGFPGETEEEFAELLAFLAEYPFDRVGAFAFSPEEGTRAAGLPGQVDESTKRRRYDALMAQQRGISAALAQKRVGSEAELLIEGVRDDFFVGRTRAEAPDVDGLVRVPFRPGYAVGRYARIRLTGALDYDMIGELL